MKTVLVTGMPRSGTSWLGQIIDSDPRVAFRMEPLFAYRFKNIVDARSDCSVVLQFLDDLVDLDDEFILQKDNRRNGYYPTFVKHRPEILALKTTRHHELIEKYLECVADLHVVAIVRHPAAAINSWTKSFKEFAKKGCVIEDDWRTGACRKGDVGEYWGFDDWLNVTKQFVALSKKYSNFELIRYSDLVRQPAPAVSALFERLGMELHPQTLQFLADCHTRHDADPYSVFKSKAVLDEWRQELAPSIRDQILTETVSAGLGEFLE